MLCLVLFFGGGGRGCLKSPMSWAAIPNAPTPPEAVNPKPEEGLGFMGTMALWALFKEFWAIMLPTFGVWVGYEPMDRSVGWRSWV